MSLSLTYLKRTTQDWMIPYADLEMTGLYVVRGDAMVLMGKVADSDPEDSDNMKRMEMEDLGGTIICNYTLK